MTHTSPALAHLVPRHLLQQQRHVHGLLVRQAQRELRPCHLNALVRRLAAVDVVTCAPHVARVAIHRLEHVAPAALHVRCLRRHAGQEEAVPVLGREAAELVRLVPELWVVCKQRAPQLCHVGAVP
jgi:hypothetical protein